MIVRNKVVLVAKKQIGVSEPVGDDQYIRWYNDEVDTSFAMDVPWCAIFVSWVLRQSGIEEEFCPNFASCTVGVNWAKKNGYWKDASTGYRPSPADLVFFDWDKNGKPNHVGIVEKIEGDILYTIEGNSTNQVEECRYELGADFILGYMALDYNNMRPSILKKEPEQKEDEQATTAVVSETTSISDIQKMLNEKFGQNLKIDGIWGAKSKKALVKAVQKAINNAYRAWLSVDGIWGPKTQKAWKNVVKGNSGDLTLLVQIALIASGSILKADGIFGKKTLKAVKEFQAKNGLETDGIVGPLTASKLMK